MRRSYNSGGNEIKVGDILYITSGNELKTVPYTQWSSSLGDVCGVCIIPSSHVEYLNTAYWGPTDKKACFIAPSFATTGTSYYQGRPTDTPQYCYFSSSKDNNNDPFDVGELIVSSDGSGWEGERFSTAIASRTGLYVNPNDPYTGSTIDNWSFVASSPYKLDGSVLEAYSSSKCKNGVSNALRSFNVEIDASLNSGYIAAHSARNYYSTTKFSGVYTLPTLGEWGYVFARYDIIEEALITCGAIGLLPRSFSFVNYWAGVYQNYSSGRVYYVTYAPTINNSHGKINITDKTYDDACVRSVVWI